MGWMVILSIYLYTYSSLSAVNEQRRAERAEASRWRSIHKRQLLDNLSIKTLDAGRKAWDLCSIIG